MSLYPKSAVMRALSRYRHPIRFLWVSASVVLLFFLNMSRLVNRDDGPVHVSQDSLGLINVEHESTISAHGPWTADSDKLTLEELQQYVAGKNGYYVRDWSLGLGWNNMRYIIEASLVQAKLLNRVLVIPSFVYARDCEYDRDLCSQYGIKVDREEAVGWDKWNGAPVDSIAWQLPIQIMLDLPLLRSYYPVILTSEFMTLHGQDPSNELLTGQWNRDIHHKPNLTSFHVIPNPSFDNDIFRVDTTLPFQSINLTDPDTQIDSLFRRAVGEEKNPLSWDYAVQTLRDNGFGVRDDAAAERLVNRGGWVVTYTYAGLGGMEYTKTVVPAIREVLPLRRVRGWVEDFTTDAYVLFLEGETHLSRKPGGFRFTTHRARNDYTHFVLTYMRPIRPLIALADELARRMTTLAGGRGWLAAHMRRGDFTIVGWVKDASLEAHLRHIKDVFEEGKKKLMRQVLRGGMPHDTDPFFIATDERNITNLAFIHQNGAITISDLLTIEDRRKLGWLLLFTDCLGIVEQRVAAASAFFYGHALSSLAGGVLNVREGMGLERNSWIID